MSSQEIFDYLIVGGGTAGLVLAARLTEDANISVCVIESGGSHTHEAENQVPGIGFKNIGRPDIHFLFNSTPQKHANDREIYIARGKALGGSSTVNYMTLGRGHKDEYDAIEQLGNKGWNWESLLGYMKKAETYTVTPTEEARFGVHFDPAFHGNSGPIHRTLPKWTTSAHDDTVKAFINMGIPYNPDPVNGDNTGVWASNHAIHHADVTRSAAAPSYYEPIKDRSNLLVITQAHVTRLLPKKTKAGEKIIFEGVEYSKDGTICHVSTRKEVILSAGSFSTPQILELSGIGDTSILKAQGVTPILNLPGDHFWVWTTFEVDPEAESLEVLGEGDRFAREWQEYQTNRSGMLTTIGASIFAFLPTPSFVDEETLQLIEKAAGDLTANSEYSDLLNLQNQWTFGKKVPTLELAYVPGFMPATDKKPEPGKRYCSVLASIQHAYSRGSVHIASPDPTAPPLIDLNCLDNEVDLKLMVEGTKYARKLASSFGKVLEEVHPGVGIDTDEGLEQVVRSTVQTVFHPVGTAAMLPLEAGGVVDDQLQVYGTENLRIVDASILPIHVSNHPMTVIYGIAEKAADLIKGYNR